jgi:hypothetical protein
MQSDDRKPSGFYYHRTNIEVRLGDRITIFRWFRCPRPAVVVYIPGVSQLHPHLEYEDVKHWAIQFEDGSLEVMAYDPSNKRYGQPGKKYRFIERGTVVPLNPAEPLE